MENSRRFLYLFVPSFPKSKFSIDIVEHGQIDRSLELNSKPLKIQDDSNRIFMKYMVLFSAFPGEYLEIEQFVDSRIREAKILSAGILAKPTDVLFDGRRSISKVNKFSSDEIGQESWNYQVDNLDFVLMSGNEVGSIFIRGFNTEIVNTFSLIKISELFS